MATPSTATLAAEVVVATLTGVMTSVAGLDLDQANDLVAGIYGIEASELPAQLPLIFELALTEL